MMHVLVIAGFMLVLLLLILVLREVLLLYKLTKNMPKSYTTISTDTCDGQKRVIYLDAQHEAKIKAEIEGDE